MLSQGANVYKIAPIAGASGQDHLRLRRLQERIPLMTGHAYRYALILKDLSPAWLSNRAHAHNVSLFSDLQIIV